MSAENKANLPPPASEPTAERSPLPMWMLVLTLVLLYVGGVYFDRHSGWFDRQVYVPFDSAAMLESYQPKSGAAAVLAQGKRCMNRFAASVMAWTGSANRDRPRRWPLLNG